MSLTSFDLVKTHTRLDDTSDAAELAYLQYLTNAAEEKIATDTNRTLDELVAMTAEGENLPLQLTHAVLMLVAHWYEERQPTSAVNLQSVPYTYESLVKPFKRFVE